MPEQCPKCLLNDQIVKISSVVKSGTSTGTYSGPTGAVSYSQGKATITPGYAMMSGTQKTHLAELFTPPSEPTQGKVFGCLGWGIIVLVIGGLLFAIQTLFSIADAQAQAGYNDVDDKNIGTVLVIILLAVVVFLFWYHPRKSRELEAKYMREHATWQRAMEKWDRLYYCYRDDVVFDPATNVAFFSTDFKSYLYQKSD